MNRIGLALVLFLAITSTIAQKSPVKIVVNYETLCPDSIRFINNGLNQAYSLFGKQLDIKFIPFGIASVIIIFSP